MKYELYAYDKQSDMYCYQKSFETLKRAKEYVEEQRNEDSLSCKLYIRADSRILKRYDSVEL